jgi:hypothetical protein
VVRETQVNRRERGRHQNDRKLSKAPARPNAVSALINRRPGRRVERGRGVQRPLMARKLAAQVAYLTAVRQSFKSAPTTGPGLGSWRCGGETARDSAPRRALSPHQRLGAAVPPRVRSTAGLPNQSMSHVITDGTRLAGAAGGSGFTGVRMSARDRRRAGPGAALHGTSRIAREVAASTFGRRDRCTAGRGPSGGAKRRPVPVARFPLLDPWRGVGVRIDLAEEAVVAASPLSYGRARPLDANFPETRRVY